MTSTNWQKRIDEAQQLRRYEIAGVAYDRIPYGSESDDWGAEDGPCHDCAAMKGQHHVPGCDVERCPACDGQAAFCDCVHTSDEVSEGKGPAA